MFEGIWIDGGGLTVSRAQNGKKVLCARTAAGLDIVVSVGLAIQSYEGRDVGGIWRSRGLRVMMA